MSGDYSMMTLGSFTFEISTAAYQEFKRTTEYLWPSQQRFGSAPALQSTGLGEDSITLSGVVFPEWNGGIGQLDRLREIAEEREPLTMIGGLGNVMGKWVIERVDETGTIFAQAGVALKQDFSLSLKKFDDEGAEGVLSAISSGVDAAAGASGGLSALPAVPSALSALSSAGAMVSAVTATANAALSTASRVTGQIGFALGKVSSISAALGVHAPAITNALNRSLVVVNGIRTSSSDGLDILRRVQTTTSAASAVKGIFNDVSSMVQPATQASKTIKSSLVSMTGSGATTETLSVVTGALVSANQATALASALQDNTNNIMNKIA